MGPDDAERVWDLLHNPKSLGFVAKFAVEQDAEAGKKRRVQSAQPYGPRRERPSQVEPPIYVHEPKPAARIDRKNPWRGSTAGVWAKPAWGPLQNGLQAPHPPGKEVIRGINLRAAAPEAAEPEVLRGLGTAPLVRHLSERVPPRP